MKTQKTKSLLFLIIILALVLTACGAEEESAPAPVLAPDIQGVIAEGRILPIQDVMLSFSARGTVDEILVEEGEKVSEGDVIIRLSDQEQAQAMLRASQFELTSAQQAYDAFVRTGGISTADAWQQYMLAQVARAEAQREWENLNTDDLQDDIDDAEAEARDREEDLQDALDETEKYQDLDEDNTKRKDAEDELEEAQEDLNEAVRDLEETIRDLDGVRATLDAALSAESEAQRNYESRADDGLDPEEKALLDARLENAKAQVTAAENALDGYTLTAPFTGTVTDINVKVGQLVGPELWAVQLADLTTFYVETNDLTELEVVKVNVGGMVEIAPDALPDVILMGTVESISQSFKSHAGDILYTVTIQLEDSDSRLRWGMTVETVFIAE